MRENYTLASEGPDAFAKTREHTACHKLKAAIKDTLLTLLLTKETLPTENE